MSMYSAVRRSCAVGRRVAAAMMNFKLNAKAPRAGPVSCQCLSLTGTQPEAHWQARAASGRLRLAAGVHPIILHWQVSHVRA